jgi:hypothetical protein
VRPILFYYIIQQGEELTCLHFLSGRLNIFKKCFHQLKAK